MCPPTYPTASIGTQDIGPRRPETGPMTANGMWGKQNFGFPRKEKTGGGRGGYVNSGFSKSLQATP